MTAEGYRKPTTRILLSTSKYHLSGPRRSKTRKLHHGPCKNPTTTARKGWCFKPSWSCWNPQVGVSQLSHLIGGDGLQKWVALPRIRARIYSFFSGAKPNLSFHCCWNIFKKQLLPPMLYLKELACSVVLPNCGKCRIEVDKQVEGAPMEEGPVDPAC